MSWTDEEIADLKYMYEHGFPRDEIVSILDKNINSVKLQIKVMNLKSPLRFKEKDGLYFCPKCRNYKTKEEFYKCKSNTYGITAWCKSCDKAKYKAKRQKALENYFKSLEKTKEEVGGVKVKKCIKCNTVKNINDFQWHRKFEKLHNYCAECRNQLSREYFLKRLEEKGY